jgi:YfiH family protein
MKTKTPKGFTAVKKGKLKLISCDAISKIPGFTQVFTTRAGGVSKKPYNSLNMGMHTDDNKKKVRLNIKMLEKSLNIKYASAARQVHGDRVLVIKGSGRGVKEEVNQEKLRKILNTDADALITNIPGLAVGVRVADCVGTVIVDPENKVVAAIHSGWRGVANRIVVKAVKTMKKEFGSKPAELIAAVSPAIGPCCYEIGDEVLKLKKHRVFSNIWKHKNGRVHMDLWQGVRNLLISQGVKENNIHICSMCTADNPELFYSHRRDKGKTGRMMAIGVYKAD